MLVLIIANPDQLRDRHWPELERHGRVHFGIHAGQPELYLELPHPRRRAAAICKATLADLGIAARAAYRDFPAYRLALPVRRLTSQEYSERHGQPSGLYAVSYDAELPCPWCGRGDLRVVHCVSVVSRPHTWTTVLFCHTCRRAVQVQAKIPRDEWPELASYVAHAPRPPAEREDAHETWLHKIVANHVRYLSPAKRRDLGLDGATALLATLPQEGWSTRTPDTQAGAVEPAILQATQLSLFEGDAP